MLLVFKMVFSAPVISQSSLQGVGRWVLTYIESTNQQWWKSGPLFLSILAIASLMGLSVCSADTEEAIPVQFINN